MELDFASMINTLIMAKIAQESPMSAKVFNVFLKRGISTTEAMAMLMEISILAAEMKEEGTDNEQREKGK